MHRQCLRHTDGCTVHCYTIHVTTHDTKLRQQHHHTTDIGCTTSQCSTKREHTAAHTSSADFFRLLGRTV